MLLYTQLDQTQYKIEQEIYLSWTRRDPGDKTTIAGLCRLQRWDIPLKAKVSLQTVNWTHRKDVTAFSNILAEFC